MTPDILDLAFLPALAAVCAATSFSDLREGKIRNIWIMSGLAWAGAVYLALSLFRLYFPELTEPLVFNTLYNGSWGRLLLLTALNALCALTCGFLLFHFNLWSAGDAKLFFVLTLLLPLKYYFRHYIPVFPGFNLFLNTITVAAVFVWTETAWKVGRFAFYNKEKNIWKEMAGAAAAEVKGATGLVLLAGVAFSLLMCATHIFALGQRASTTLTLLTMLALLFGGKLLNKALQNGTFRLRLGAFAAVFFAALLLSSLRLQFLRMALVMSATFLALYLFVGILPSLSAKYKVGGGDMPFATWLSVGLFSTILIKGSFLYLLLF
ncbi:MAG: hypothetical protein A2285_06010 [Elusimicrobia bacterium RIFOXYA12_FULL_57_11]|nr:MAG: hypothetical protein A2285_06010 [Elusimicrobia bacterium RIFOXYA12_FULL_57_11]